MHLQWETPNKAATKPLDRQWRLIAKTMAHTYLLTQLPQAYKAGNIFETVEDKAKATINGLYKVVHWLSIATKMYDLE